MAVTLIGTSCILMNILITISYEVYSICSMAIAYHTDFIKNKKCRYLLVILHDFDLTILSELALVMWQ